MDDRPDCWRRFASNRDMGAIVWSGLMLDYVAKLAL